ncbi:hypothetical protein [Streptomyces roseoverticillatus]|uniref:Uncharacterized protein n=1 Tax=Streptomyces roseoverticillatus TaxID=66429 RepID=A0ABV3J920_9ACTN
MIRGHIARVVKGLRERLGRARKKFGRKIRAGLAFGARAIGAGLLAAVGGLLAAVPGLLLALPRRLLGGRGKSPLTWGGRVARLIFKRLIVRARAMYAEASGANDVLTRFKEPGRRPAKFGFPTDYFGGNLMSVFQRETEAMREAYSRYEPPMMLAVAAEYWGLQEGITSVGEAVRQLAVNTSDKYPADAKMADLVAQVYDLLHQAAEAAAEVGPLFAKVHADDLRRHEDPRPGEHMWNILERRADGSYSMRSPSQFVAVCQDIAHVYARYEPGHMAQVAAEYEGIPAGIENVAAAIHLLQVRSAETYPVEKGVVEAIADLHGLLQKAASAAQELMPAFRRLHAPDIARHEEPRNGESGEAMWDTP